MKDIKRVSPVKLKGIPLKVEKYGQWNIVLEYADEGDGPWLTDLSHRPRFDLQNADVGAFTPFGVNIPDAPGKTAVKDGLVVNRTNNTQVSIYNLAGQYDLPMPQEPGYTDVTEATLCVALFSMPVFSICEKLTALDFMDPQKKAPFLFQGPFCHVPCQIVTLDKSGDLPGIVLTCSRGYGRDMIHAILEAGAEFDLKPAGETRFVSWFDSL